MQTLALPAPTDESPRAGLLCLFGFFLHIVLSGPLLEALGFHYLAADQGAFYQKIHPGTWFIYLSFFMLIWEKGNPLARLFFIYRGQRIACWLLVISLIATCYMVVRSGAGGISVMVDTHLTVPLCAIVLVYTPPVYCKRALQLFIFIAAANSFIGIMEALGKFRIFAFDPTWDVLNEDYFRASALRGHPLTNAAFTAVAIFILLGLRYPFWLKAIILLLMMLSLVAFGGRSSLLISVIGLGALGLIKTLSLLFCKRLSMLQAIGMTMAVLITPVCMAGGLYLAINSSMGERLSAHSEWDESADARGLAPLVLDYMSDEEKIFGVSNERIDDITYRLNLKVALGFIENPWLLMFMRMGAVLFCFWLAATLAFTMALMRRVPLSAKLAVLVYFAISSTYNSFGTKDATYMMMVCAVMCVKRTGLRIN